MQLPLGFHTVPRIGKGGKMDDTSCVVAEIIEWTDLWTKPTGQDRLSCEAGFILLLLVSVYKVPFKYW